MPSLAAIIPFMVLVFVFFGLSSCTNKSVLENSFETYANRMANILDVKPIELAYPVLSTSQDSLPRKTDVPEVENGTISLITLSKLNQCGLGPLIAQRNTSLGKVQLPSTRLMWEYAFNQQLKACSKQVLDPSIKDLVFEMLERKEAAWEKLWGYFMQTSNPMRQSLQQNVGLIKNSNEGLVETQAALAFINSLKSINENNATVIDINQLEEHLQNLDIYKLPAATWRTQVFLTRNLNLLTQWLKINFDYKQCVENPTTQRRAQYLRNVFELFFISEIQPISSRLNTYLYEINPTIENLLRSNSISPAFNTWVKNKSDSRAYKKAMSNHIDYWQQLFRSCEFTPGNK